MNRDDIDPLYKSGRMRRKTLYRRLQDWFGREVHIGEADVAMCKAIIAVPLDVLAPVVTDR